jgi:hypothetical protein
MGYRFPAGGPARPASQAWRCVAPRRFNGTGSVLIRADAGGREHRYAKWRDGGRQVKRRIGPERASGSRDGLTRTHAEHELRRLMDEPRLSRSPRSLSLEEAGAGMSIAWRCCAASARRSWTTARRSACTWCVLRRRTDHRDPPGADRALSDRQAARRPFGEEHPERPGTAVRRPGVRGEVRLGLRTEPPRDDPHRHLRSRAAISTSYWVRSSVRSSTPPTAAWPPTGSPKPSRTSMTPAQGRRSARPGREGGADPLRLPTRCQLTRDGNLSPAVGC